MSMIYESQYKFVGKAKLDHIQHTHEDLFEIIQVWNDEGCFLINDMSYSMKQGAVFLIDAAFFHYSAPKDNERYTRSKVFLSRTGLEAAACAFGFTKELEVLFGNGGSVIYLAPEDIYEADSFLRRICKGDREDSTALDRAIYILKLFRLLVQKQGQMMIPARESLLNIIHAINKLLSEQITIDILSRETYMNKYYLCHYFKEHTGMALMDYVNMRRIMLAKELLMSGKEPVADVAERCGYNSPSYFGKKFKEITGMSPREYRRSCIVSE